MYLYWGLPTVIRYRYLPIPSSSYPYPVPDTVIQFWMTVIGLLWSSGAVLDANSTVPVLDDEP